MKNDPSYYLFVYGTLRNGFNIPVQDQIKDNIEWLGTSEIKGKLYDIGDYPAALPAEKNAKSTIKGEVIKLHNPKKVLKVLDAYEGYNPKELSKSEYYRNKETITLQDGKQIDAWVYWYNFPVAGKRRIRHKDYLNYLKKKNTA